MNLFPIFLKLAGRRTLVVGGGTIGEGKIASLLEAGAETVVVAPKVTEKVGEWASTAKIAWLARDFSPADLDGAFLCRCRASCQHTRDKQSSHYRSKRFSHLFHALLHQPLKPRAIPMASSLI